MVSLNPKQAKIVGVMIILLALALLGAMTYYFFAFLSEFISGPGAFCLFGVSFVLFMKTVIRLLIFPGSFSLWRRNLESHFCKEMSSQLSNRIACLRMTIEILLEGNLDDERGELLPRCVAATTQAKRMLEQLMETLELLRKEGSLRRRQLDLYRLLTEFKQALQAAKLGSPQSRETSLWDWFSCDMDEADFIQVSFSDFPHNQQGLLVRNFCEQIERFLLESYGQASFIGKIKRWLFDNTLGNIDQIRIELKRRFKSENFWVSTEDGKLLDCIWFWTEDSKADTPSVLMCNPNAGFYEFAYYQNEWLEFYLDYGVNVCMWNYRGYGRSSGTPTLLRLQKDAVCVLKHLKDVRGATRIAAHGESMGGAVVTYLAAQCRLEFVFADRTFWSLEKTAYFNFGRTAQILLRLFAGKSIDSAENFLTANCPKFLSADPADSMISDLSSLKAGVAERVVLGSTREFRYLPEANLISMAEAYTRLMKLMTECERSPQGTKVLNVQYGKAEANHSYQLLSKDSETVDDEALSALFQRFSNSISYLDAGGKAFRQLHIAHNPKEIQQALKSWILVLDVWGSYDNIRPSEFELTRALAIDRARKCAGELQNLTAEHESYMSNALINDVCKDIGVLSSCFLKIASCLESHLSKISEASSSTLSSYSRVAIDFSRAGLLVPLSCGHSGPFNIAERTLYEEHLIRIGFIVNSSFA